VPFFTSDPVTLLVVLFDPLGGRLGSASLLFGKFELERRVDGLQPPNG